MNKLERVELRYPKERKQLEPFATLFRDVVVLEAARSKWLESAATPPKRALERISRRIEFELNASGNQQLHPAIWVHALLVCAHFFHQHSSDSRNLRTRQRQIETIELAGSMLQFLKLHHGLYELYLMIS